MARIGERGKVYRVMVVKPEGKSPLRRHRCAWWYNVKMDLKGIE